MIISLSEIMNTRDKVENINAPIEMDTFDLQSNSYKFSKKDYAKLVITNLGNRKVMIEAKANISLILNCSRCLKDLEYPIDIHFVKEIDFNLTGEERAKDLDETNYIEEYDLNVDTLIYEEILIGFPMKLLCSEECKGICKKCGQNFNDGSCSCDTTEYDPRMERIRDIFNNFKEV